MDHLVLKGLNLESIDFEIRLYYVGNRMVFCIGGRIDVESAGLQRLWDVHRTLPHHVGS